MKRQKWIEGSFVKVELNDKSFFIIRLFQPMYIAIYNRHFDASCDIKPELLNELVGSEVLRYIVMSDFPVKRGELPIVGHLPLSQVEIDAFPPSFTQNAFFLERCKLFFYDGTMREATPEECVGLTKVSVYELHHLYEHLENHVSNLPNLFWIHDKVKLP